MIESDKIYDTANRLIKRCKSRDPEEICRSLGIIIQYRDFEDLLGVYTVMIRNRIIILNNKLDDTLKKMVLAHELGHDALHRDLASSGSFNEYRGTNFKDLTEYEANAFASHLLIDNAELLELAKEGYTTSQIANSLSVHEQFLLAKVTELNRLNYSFKLPNSHKQDFLKDVSWDTFS